MKMGFARSRTIACILLISGCGGAAAPDTTSATAPSSSTAETTPPNTSAVGEGPTDAQVASLLATSEWNPQAIVDGAPFKWRANQTVQLIDFYPEDEYSLEETTRTSESSGSVEGGTELREYVLTIDTATSRAGEQVTIGDTVWTRVGVLDSGNFYSAQEEPLETVRPRQVPAFGLLAEGQSLFETWQPDTLERVGTETIGAESTTRFHAEVVGGDAHSQVEATFDFWVSAGPKIVRLAYHAEQVEDQLAEDDFVAGTITEIVDFEMYEVGIPVDGIAPPAETTVDPEIAMLADLGALIREMGLPANLTPDAVRHDIDTLCAFMASDPPPSSTDIFDEMDRITRHQAESLGVAELDSASFDILLFAGTGVVCPELPLGDVTTTTSEHEGTLALIRTMWQEAATGTEYPTLPNEVGTAHLFYTVALEACATLDAGGTREDFLVALIIGAASLLPGSLEGDPMGLSHTVLSVLTDIATDVVCPQHADMIGAAVDSGS